MNNEQFKYAVCKIVIKKRHVTQSLWIMGKYSLLNNYNSIT